MITLKPHQQAIIDWEDKKFQHLDPKRFGIFLAPRVGKTFVVLELFKKYNVRGLIVVPKKTKTAWEKDVKTFGVPHTVITKEEFRRDHKTLPRYNAVAIDESHHFSNTKSQLTKSMIWYLKKHDVEYRWLATGTPFRSNPLNIFAIYVLLGRDINYWTFFNQFYSQVNMGGRMIPVPRRGMESKLEEYIKKVGITLALKDVVPVPDAVDYVEYFDFTPEQLEAIKNLEETVFIARFSKLHQIEQGFVYGDEYTPTKQMHCLKTLRVLELANKHKKIAISCKFTRQIDLLAELLMPRKVYIIDGRMKEDRKKLEDEIRESGDCVVILQSGSTEGMDLSSIGTMIFASLSYSHLDHTQTKARLENLEVLSLNTYYYLLTNGIDIEVHKKIMQKQDFHESLFINRI